jgi:endonuclease/exonuclease/phosphatase family metal-dependent hydrolase
MTSRLLAVAGCALAAAGCGGSAATGAGLARPPGGSTFTLMQMNLCLSGIAECYARVAYPAGVEEAAALIRRAQPDAATFSEACSGDLARIARETGYHLRFSTVIYRGAPFRCVHPGGRGVFGDAVLSRAPVVNSENHAFRAQSSFEHRRWLCVTTRAGVEVCTAHLDTRDTVEVVGNDGECPELAGILARPTAARAVIFGGDVNRPTPCAPAGFWRRSDASGDRDAGLQQVYGSGAFRSPSARVVRFAHSDHDVLLVRARLAG